MMLQYLKKKQATEETIIHDIQQLILAAKKRTLMLEIDRKNEEYLHTENPELKTELMALQAEMAKLKENE